MKKILPLLVILLILGIVGISGCTDSGTKEIVVKKIDVADLGSGGVFGGQKSIVDIPDNATGVRAVYNLTAENSYGMGSNGNIGFTSENIDPNSGEDPVGFDNKYLEGGAGKTISGEIESSSTGAFYYTGSFAKGTITVYATVPA